MLENHMSYVPVPTGFKRLRPDAKAPEYANLGLKGDLAADLFYAGDNPVELKPGDRHTFGTGLGFEFCPGFCGIVGDRSGLARKNGIHVLGGRIDGGYTGEVGVILINLGHEDYVVEPGDKIAQMQVMPFYQARFYEVEELKETARSASGFGSTGR